MAATFLVPISTQAQECRPRPDIAVGGVAGFVDLSEPGNTKELRDLCKVHLYLHGTAWNRTAGDKQHTILEVFSGTGVPVVEIGMHPDSVEFFRHEFTHQFVDKGVKATEAHVNGFEFSHPIAEWKAFVDAGRKYGGLSMMAPVFSPNTGQFAKGRFSSPIWDNIRSAAQYGGGLTIDAPPDFFFKQSDAYRQFIIDEIRWATSRRLHSTVIVSPGHSGVGFLKLTMDFITVLRTSDALPTNYIVENYSGDTSPDYKNRVGGEQDHNSVAGVALWLAKSSFTMRPELVGAK